MKKVKSLGLLVVVTALLLYGLGTFAFADVLDDTINGGVNIGQVVQVGTYNYYYMGNGYFICTTVPTNAVYNSTSNYNNWACSPINASLNNGTINLGTTSQGVGIYADTRVAYVTIPSLDDYEQVSCMEKGSSTLAYWLRSPYYNNSYYVWYVSGFSVSNYHTSYSGGVRPAFRLKSEITGGGSSPVFTVVKSQSFAVAMKGELRGATGNVTASSTAGSGYTLISGTISDSDANGIKKVAISGRNLFFKVISPPTPSTTATVSFGV